MHSSKRYILKCVFCDFYLISGNSKQAIAQLDRATVIIKNEFGDKHYKYGIFLNALGLAYSMANDNERAYLYAKQALNILLDALGVDNFEIYDVYLNLGDICRKMILETNHDQNRQLATDKNMKLEEAKSYYSKAHRLIQKTLGDQHEKTQKMIELLSNVNSYRTA